MWIASSTSPPGGAGPSATSSGTICCACANDGSTSKERSRSNRRNIVTALRRNGDLVEVRSQPTFGLLDRHPAARGIILELIAPDACHPEILAVAVAEVEAGHGRGRKHREILGQRHFGRVAA